MPAKSNRVSPNTTGESVVNSVTRSSSPSNSHHSFIQDNSIEKLEKGILPIFEGFQNDLNGSKDSVPSVSWMRHNNSKKHSSGQPERNLYLPYHRLGTSSSSLPLDALDFADSFHESSVSLLTLDPHIFQDNEPIHPNNFHRDEESDAATFHRTARSTVSNGSTWDTLSMSSLNTIAPLTNATAAIEGIEIFEDELTTTAAKGAGATDQRRSSIYPLHQRMAWQEFQIDGMLSDTEEETDNDSPDWFGSSCPYALTVSGSSFVSADTIAQEKDPGYDQDDMPPLDAITCEYGEETSQTTQYSSSALSSFMLDGVTSNFNDSDDDEVPLLSTTSRQDDSVGAEAPFPPRMKRADGSDGANQPAPLPSKIKTRAPVASVTTVKIIPDNACSSMRLHNSMSSSTKVPAARMKIPRRSVSAKTAVSSQKKRGAKERRFKRSKSANCIPKVKLGGDKSEDSTSARSSQSSKRPASEKRSSKVDSDARRRSVGPRRNKSSSMPPRILSATSDPGQRKQSTSKERQKIRRSKTIGVDQLRSSRSVRSSLAARGTTKTNKKMTRGRSKSNVLREHGASFDWEAYGRCFLTID